MDVIKVEKYLQNNSDQSHRHRNYWKFRWEWIVLRVNINVRVALRSFCTKKYQWNTVYDPFATMIIFIRSRIDRRLCSTDLFPLKTPRALLERLLTHDEWWKPIEFNPSNAKLDELYNANYLLTLDWLIPVVPARDLIWISNAGRVYCQIVLVGARRWHAGGTLSPTSTAIPPTHVFEWTRRDSYSTNGHQLVHNVRPSQLRSPPSKSNATLTVRLITAAPHCATLRPPGGCRSRSRRRGFRVGRWCAAAQCCGCWHSPRCLWELEFYWDSSRGGFYFARLAHG